MNFLSLTPPPDDPLPPIQPGTLQDANPDSRLANPGVSSLVALTKAEIAPWGYRLIAAILDILAATILLVFANELARGLPGLGPSWAGIVGLTMFYLYFPVSQVFTHNTLGKYICRIQVVRDYDQALPTNRQVAIREVSRWVLGGLCGWLGVVFRLGDPRRQSWHDSLADTIVVVRPVKQTVIRCLLAAVITCLAGAIFFSGVHANGIRQQKTAELSRKLVEKGKAADSLERDINALIRRNGSLSEIQENNRKILGLLDSYEGQLRDLQKLIENARKEKWPTPAQANQFLRMSVVYATMLDQAAVQRQRAEMILSFKPGQSVQRFQAELTQLNARASALTNSIAAQERDLRIGNRDSSVHPPVTVGQRK